MDVIDLLPEFISSGRDDLYFRLDDHWTPEGNYLAAESIARHLMQYRDFEKN